MYQVHLDNTHQSAPPNMYSNKKRKKSKKVKQKKSSKRKYSASHPSEKSSAGFVTINYLQPVIQFGGTETKKEVQYILKTLNQSNRKHSYHAVNYINNNNNNNMCTY